MPPRHFQVPFIELFNCIKNSETLDVYKHVLCDWLFWLYARLKSLHNTANVCVCSLFSFTFLEAKKEKTYCITVSFRLTFGVSVRKSVCDRE